MILIDGDNSILAHIHQKNVKLTALGLKKGLTCPENINIAAQPTLFGNKTSFTAGDEGFGQAFAIFLLESDVLSRHEKWSLREGDEEKRILLEQQ